MNIRTVTFPIVVLLLVAGCRNANHSTAPSALAAPVACADLAKTAGQGMSISSASPIAAGQFKSPVPDNPMQPPVDYSRLPAFCRVAGTLTPSADSQIGFELWLPAANWNGKFMQVGNGGAAGAIVYFALADGLQRGYAVANTDTGHQGGMGEFTWAANHPEKVTDYAWRAVHELTTAGRALTAAHYGKPPAKSYWSGCSTGGRQGLMEAQRFPEDFDAIIAGAPANNWVPLMALSMHIARNVGTPDGLGLDKLALLKEATIKQCDAQDGVTDRVISMAAACKFDPAALRCKTRSATQCLTPAEVAAAQRVYAGVVTRSGQSLFPGTGFASEPLWGAYASPPFRIGGSFFQNVVANDPNWDPLTFDVDKDIARAQAASTAIAAVDPDLSRFVARGGKLLLYHGTTDGLIPYGNTENYYRAVAEKLGPDLTGKHVRFFAVPGMDHCAGGEGPFAVDWIAGMEQWDGTGVAPDALPASHPPLPPTGKGFSRVVCAAPTVPHYNGNGKPDDAASWSCAAS